MDVGSFFGGKWLRISGSRLWVAGRSGDCDFQNTDQEVACFCFLFPFSREREEKALSRSIFLFLRVRGEIYEYNYLLGIRVLEKVFGWLLDI